MIRPVNMLRADGLRVVIHLNDHQPAYLYVFGNGEAKVNLVAAGHAPDLVWADNMTRAEVRRAMRLVTEHQAVLLQRWESTHGRTG